MKIGIIGYGRFGALASRYLAKDFSLVVYDTNTPMQVPPSIEFASLAKACSQDIVIPCVPMGSFAQVIQEISPLLSKDCLVIDVCSVKQYPISIMQKFLPPQVSILGTHPMFGPDSARSTIENKKMVLCPERIEAEVYQKIVHYLKNKKLQVIETTAEEHDRQIAHSQVLTHFIGRTLIEFGAEEIEIDTEGYKRLRHILEVVQNDTWELFENMNTYNSFTPKVREKFLSCVKHISERLDK